MSYVVLLRYNNQCPKKVTAISLLYKHGGGEKIDLFHFCHRYLVASYNITKDRVKVTMTSSSLPVLPDSYQPVSSQDGEKEGKPGGNARS